MTDTTDELVEAVDAQHTTTAEDTLDDFGETQACVSLTCLVGSGDTPIIILDEVTNARR